MHLTVTGPHEFRWIQEARRPLAAGEVRVRTLLSAVSVASELAVVARGPFPARLGYQTLGVVDEVGSGGHVARGQRVITTLGHADTGVHRADRLIPVPDGISDRVALAVILGEETHKGIRKIAPRPQERVLVAGAGLLGLLSVFNLTRRGSSSRHRAGAGCGAAHVGPAVRRGRDCGSRRP